MSENEVATKKTNTAILDDAELERLATEELMREAVQGAARAEAIGPSGWLKVKVPKANKRFLANTIRNAVSSNNYNSTQKRSHSNRDSHRENKKSESSLKRDRKK